MGGARRKIIVETVITFLAFSQTLVGQDSQLPSDEDCSKRSQTVTGVSIIACANDLLHT
jgi:hypothetical protein